MPLLRLVAGAAFALAAIFVLAAAIMEDFTIALTALAPAISGVLFLALDRIVTALEAIREQIAPSVRSVETERQHRPSDDVLAETAGRLQKRGMANRHSRRSSLRKAKAQTEQGTSEI